MANLMIKYLTRVRGDFSAPLFEFSLRKKLIPSKRLRLLPRLPTKNLKTMPIQCFDKFCKDLNDGMKILADARAFFLLLALLGSYSTLLSSQAYAEGSASFSGSSIDYEIGPDSVGTVRLLLGKATVASIQEDNRQVKQLLAVGSQIKVGDKITTQANSTVHLLFVDGANVAIRSGSELEILNYQYDKARPEASKVKFNLVRGVTRAISGDAAKSARDQFRLNTPIAAIGVRGTDFVVSATEFSTRALVNEGIIVMAPLSASCSFDSFGPCIANAVELSGENMQVAELDQTSANPRVLPAAQDRGAEVLQQEVRLLLASNDAANNEASNNSAFIEEVFVEESTSTRVVVDATITDAPMTGGSGPTTPDIIDPITTDPITPDPVAPSVPSFTPELPVAAATLTTSQLVWGRYAGGVGDLERITLPLAEARVGREVSVGNFDYGLFRVEDEKQRVDAGLGVIGFDLRSAQASYKDASGISAMTVLGGNLDIDFQLNRFATELNLQHSEAGLIDFTASGGLFDGGYFHSRNDDQRIAGAVSLDGTEAGYFFERQLDGASIQGLTLWDSQ
jgi:hypothetical protein